MNLTMRWAALASLLVPMSAWAANTGSSSSRTYTVGIDVDVHGTVTSNQMPPQVPAAVARLLAAALRDWHFHPATMGGHAVPAHTYVHILLRARTLPDGRGRVRLTYVDNGPRRSPGNAAPKFPTIERMLHHSAFLMLSATVQTDGSLGDLKLESRVYGNRVPNAFRSAVMRVAEHWRFDPVTLAGKPISSHIRIPIYFELATRDEIFVDHRQLRFLKEQARQRKAEEAADDAHSMPLANGQLATLDSPLKPERVATLKMSVAP